MRNEIPLHELKSWRNIAEKEGTRAIQRYLSMKQEYPASSEWEG
jgi:hypothetical protein